ncbi:Fe2+-dependent dioxygenase [Rubrivivax gelatinosus]|uniref:PKHD-type hydroxylase YbiX n=1 Tax=Rubrivivax gelatinosus (strain NBRC 100245 / IL144) TaxID=983917 RepID=I0HXI9_RUBGI|nr:Fe2+-dependent dioxygenase [Rubrivivax gelatinosus]MBG6079658.1 PKHD-type hydroxylase [Rubrivivax gelatinosus]BAL97726.1 PKHD-type hydroxylase YbiX [Rubrivivax gelatinosus IL144]
MLLRLDGVLAPEALAEARALLARGEWVDGRTTAGAQAAQVKRNRQLRADAPETQALQQLVLGALERHALFFTAALPKRVLPPGFNRYGGEANHYGNHVDQAIRYHPQTRQAIRTDISCTVFLSDPADYDGGELVIEDTFGERRVKFAAGDAVLYPGTSVHRVEPVTRGERLAAFFWIESLVRSDEQRRLLFDLDMSLVALRERHGESAETVALTGTYHNLLRQWADS